MYNISFQRKYNLFYPATNQEIIDIIHGMKSKYSKGLDDIPIQLKKTCDIENKHFCRLISVCQYGYRAKSSTELACTEFMQKIYNYLDKGDKVTAMFFDMTMAFDIVDKNLLEQKLYCIGIIGNSLNWITSYLTNRKIIVSLGREVSDEADT